MWFVIAISVVGVWALYSWKAWHVPEHQSVPAVWRTMAYRHPDAADALRIRKELSLAYSEDDTPELASLLAAIDPIIDAISQFCLVRETSCAPDDVCRAAVALLVEVDDLRAKGRLRPTASMIHRLGAQHADLIHGLRLRGLTGQDEPQEAHKPEKFTP